MDYTQKERDSFLKDDLGLGTEDVLDIFLDPSTLHLHPTLATSALFAEILSRLFAGVQWGGWQLPSVQLGGSRAACLCSCYWSPTTLPYFSVEAPF